MYYLLKEVKIKKYINMLSDMKKVFEFFCKNNIIYSKYMKSY